MSTLYTQPITCDWAKCSETKRNGASRIWLAKLISEYTDNSVEANALTILVLMKKEHPDDPLSKYIIELTDDGSGLSKDALYHLVNHIFDSYNAKQRDAEDADNASISCYGIGFHNAGMTLGTNVRVTSTHEGTCHQLDIDYKTCHASVPIEVPSPQTGTVITITGVKSELVQGLIDDESCRTSFRKNMGDLNRRAITSRGLQLKVKVEGDGEGCHGGWHEVNPKDMITETETIPGGRKVGENTQYFNINTHSKYFVEVYALHANVDAAMNKDTYSSGLIELYFPTMYNKDGLYINDDTADIRYSTDKLLSITVKSSGKNHQDYVKQSNYLIKTYTREKLERTHTLIGRLPIDQYCYLAAPEHEEYGGLSIESAAKHTNVLKFTGSVGASGRHQFYYSTYGAILKTAPADVNNLPKHILGSLAHMLQEKATLDYSCFDPRLISVILYQRALYINLLTRCNDKKRSDADSSPTTVVDSVVVGGHARREHVIYKPDLRKTRDILHQTLRNIHGMLDSATSIGSDQKAELTVRMLEQANELARTVDELKQLG
jgi:hypothetical protein